MDNLDIISENNHLKDPNYLYSLQKENLNCVDCDKPMPKYVSVNNGILICDDCLEIHKQFSYNISYLRAIDDEWDFFLLLFIQRGGNARFKKFIVDYKMSDLKQKKYLTRICEFYRFQLRSEVLCDEPPPPVPYGQELNFVCDNIEYFPEFNNYQIKNVNECINCGGPSIGQKIGETMGNTYVFLKNKAQDPELHEKLYNGGSTFLHYLEVTGKFIYEKSKPIVKFVGKKTLQGMGYACNYIADKIDTNNTNGGNENEQLDDDENNSNNKDNNNKDNNNMPNNCKNLNNNIYYNPQIANYNNNNNMLSIPKPFMPNTSENQQIKCTNEGNFNMQINPQNVIYNNMINPSYENSYNNNCNNYPNFSEIQRIGNMNEQNSSKLLDKPKEEDETKKDSSQPNPYESLIKNINNISQIKINNGKTDSNINENNAPPQIQLNNSIKSKENNNNNIDNYNDIDNKLENSLLNKISYFHCNNSNSILENTNKVKARKDANDILLSTFKEKK